MPISRYTTPIEQTLEKYVPVPMDTLYKAAEAIQQRGDLAEQAQAQTEFGLASMEALAPEYKNFVNSYVNEYKTKASDILSKVGGNTSNPDFVREIKRLNTQFASDPRLQVIKQGNEAIKQNQQLAARMKAEGKLFINPQFTGVDERGQLTANVPQVEGVNVLDEWMKTGAIAHSSIVDVGKGLETNEPNLNAWKQAVMNDVEGQSKLMRAYISQGYSPEQAKVAVQTELQGLINTYGVRSNKNYELERLNLAYQERNDRLRREAEEKEKNIPELPRTPVLDTNTPITEQVNPFKNKLEEIKNTLKNLNKGGGIKKGTFDVKASDENRKKYPDGYLAPLGVSGEPVWRVPGNNYNPTEYNNVIEARRGLGDFAFADKEKGIYKSDRTILKLHAEALEQSAKDFKPMTSYNKDLNNVFEKIYIGDKGQNINKLYKIGEGSLEEVDRSKLTDYTYQGLTTSPTDQLPDGFIKVNAYDENKNVKAYAIPIPEDVKRRVASSSAIYEYLNTGKINYNKVSPVYDKNQNLIKGLFRDPATGEIYEPKVQYDSNSKKYVVKANKWNNQGKAIGTMSLSEIEKQNVSDLYGFIKNNQGL